MNIILFWSSFIVFTSFSDNLNSFHYFLLSSFMLCITYTLSQTDLFKLSLKSGIILSNIPMSVLWYIIFVYNDFLNLNPVAYELLLILLFTYILIVVYLYFTIQSKIKLR